MFIRESCRLLANYYLLRSKGSSGLKVILTGPLFLITCVTVPLIPFFRLSTLRTLSGDQPWHWHNADSRGNHSRVIGAFAFQILRSIYQKNTPICSAPVMPLTGIKMSRHSQSKGGFDKARVYAVEWVRPGALLCTKFIYETRVIMAISEEQGNDGIC